MPKPKTKDGQIRSFYLSRDVLLDIDRIRWGRSNYVERAIRAFRKKKR